MIVIQDFIKKKKHTQGDLITLYILKEETHNYVSFTHERGCLKPREESGIRTQSN